MTIAWVLTGVAIGLVGLSLATSGHAATAPPQWLTRPSLFLHGVGVAFWLGALAPLAAMARQHDEVLPWTLKTFSSCGAADRGAARAGRPVLAIIQLESFAALIETRYGVILSIKLALVAGLLALAALNRFRFTPCGRSRLLQYAASAAIGAAGMRRWRSASSPSSPAGASRRRRAYW